MDTKVTALPPENAIDTQNSYEMYQYLVKAIHAASTLYLIIGKILCEFYDRKLYLDIGKGGYDNWPEFLRSPEFGLSPVTLQAYMNIYRYYVQRLQLTEDELAKVPVNRLNALMAKLKQQPDDEAIDTIREVAPLAHRDYVIKSREEGLMLFDRPNVMRDGTTGKWIIEAKDDQILKIIIDDNLILDNSAK